MFYEKNNLFLGLALGLAIPFVGYAVLQMILEFAISQLWIRGMFRERSMAIMALVLNVILVRYYSKHRKDESVKGVVIATVIYAVLWIVFFGKEIVNS